MADQIRVGVIGVGGMGQGHCSRLAAGIEGGALAAVCDVDSDTLKAVSEKYGVPGYSTHHELLKGEKVDAVVIATPHYFHPTVGIDAFDAGMHVLTEKPIAVTVGAAEPFIAKAKASGKVFSIMFQTRAGGQYLAARKLIDDGEIGEIYRASMLATGFRTQRYYDSGGWRATWSGEGGGVVINQAPHYLDLFTALAGAPTKVCAQVNTRIHRIEVEDFAHCIMELPNGGTGYLCVSTDEAPGTNRIEICGDKAKMVLEDGKVFLSRLDPPSLRKFSDECEAVWAFPKSQREEIPIPPSAADHGVVLQNFVNAILGKEELMIDGAVGLVELELGNAIHLSAHRGKPVDLPLDRAEVEDLFEELRRNSQIKENVKVTRETDPQHIEKK